jgi:hypothetical protein
LDQLKVVNKKKQVSGKKENTKYLKEEKEINHQKWAKN